MPVKNPSPELLERIRVWGTCPETGVAARWGYHPSQDAKIFILEKGEGLPKGWAAAPIPTSDAEPSD